MKNIENILAELGIDVPEDKTDALKKAVHENYKTIAEFEKLETKASNFKEQAESAKETIEKFKDIDVEAMNKELDAWKKKSEEAEKQYQTEIYERDFNDALNKELDKIKFSSKSARQAVLNKVKGAGLQLKDGKVYGLADVIADIQNEDASAFVNEQQEQLEQNKVVFTKPIETEAPAGITKEQIMAIADRAERRKAIKNNPGLFGK